MAVEKDESAKLAAQLMEGLGAKPELAEVLLRLIDTRIEEMMRVRPDEGLLKVTDVARLLNLSVRYVETMIADGLIRYMRFGRRRRFSREAVEACKRDHLEPVPGSLRRAA